MAVKYKVVAPTGKYTDAQGNEKTRYVDVGVIIETRNGLMLKAEAIPVNWDGTAFLNDPQPRQQSTGRRRRDEFSDDVPNF